jgi:VWFA-related protein
MNFVHLFSLRSILSYCSVLLLGLCAPCVHAEDALSKSSRDAAEQQYKQNHPIRIEVNEVRLDAVVVDSKGRQIKDLTSNDFDVYQDGNLQKVISALYIDNHRSGKKNEAKSETTAPLVSSPMLAKEDVQQAIIFIVDDLTMSFENIHYTRMAIRKFIESEMRPGDMVAILKISGGSSALQMFSADKRELLSFIKNIRWNVFNAGSIDCQGG